MHAIFDSTALSSNLSLNSGTELWLGQVQWCRSMLNIWGDYYAIFSPFPTLRVEAGLTQRDGLFFNTLYFYPNYSFIG